MKGLLWMLVAILFFVLLPACSTCRPIVETHYVEPVIPATPAAPDYFTVSWQAKDGNYCVDSDNAKNLLKNIELKNGRESELVAIIDGLRKK